MRTRLVAASIVSMCACEPTGARPPASVDAVPVDGAQADGAAPDGAILDASVTPDANVIPIPDAELDVPDAEVTPDAAITGFVFAGTLSRPRWDHEAALLPDGRVAIIGGWRLPDDDSAIVAMPEIEVFDPQTGTFTVTAQLAHPRYGHRVTSLADGRVLVTGGRVTVDNIRQDTATTEIYDPVTDTITDGPSLVLARTGHTATLLADGRVLITGGSTNDDPDPDSTGVAVAEVYDPVTSTFALVGPMTEERHAHAAARLADGRVLLTGGADAPSCCADGIAETELFDPQANTFAVALPMITPRPGHRSVTLWDGRVLVIGGSLAHGGADGGFDVVATELFDPVTDKFVATDEMDTGPGDQEFRATLLLDGRVLVTGGHLGNGAALYDPAAGLWRTSAAPMTATRANHTATRLLGGQVLVVGGDPGGTVEIYSP